MCRYGFDNIFAPETRINDHLKSVLMKNILFGVLCNVILVAAVILIAACS